MEGVTPGKNSIAEGGEEVNGVLNRKRARVDPLILNILFLWKLIVKEKLMEVYQSFYLRRMLWQFINFY